jgi:excisionase family DNA binding protein
VEDLVDKLLLNAAEAAKALGIGRSKVYELLQTGQLRSVHIGTCRRIPVEALHDLLAELRRTG